MGQGGQGGLGGKLRAGSAAHLGELERRLGVGPDHDVSVPRRATRRVRLGAAVATGKGCFRIVLRDSAGRGLIGEGGDIHFGYKVNVTRFVAITLNVYVINSACASVKR